MTRIRNRLAVALVAGALLCSLAPVSTAAASTPHFANCTAMHKSYKHGVGRKGAHDHVSGSSKPVTNFSVSTTIYNANSKLDRDHDGIACEAH